MDQYLLYSILNTLLATLIVFSVYKILK